MENPKGPKIWLILLGKWGLVLGLLNIDLLDFTIYNSLRFLFVTLCHFFKILFYCLISPLLKKIKKLDWLGTIYNMTPTWSKGKSILFCGVGSIFFTFYYILLNFFLDLLCFMYYLYTIVVDIIIKMIQFHIKKQNNIY